MSSVSCSLSTQNSKLTRSPVFLFALPGIPSPWYSFYPDVPQTHGTWTSRSILICYFTSSMLHQNTYPWGKNCKHALTIFQPGTICQTLCTVLGLQAQKNRFLLQVRSGTVWTLARLSLHSSWTGRGHPHVGSLCTCLVESMLQWQSMWPLGS